MEMLLKSVRATGFRSIEKAELDSCGRFNVLIGKNNSGKSNLLSAILGFFGTLSSGEIVDLQPKFSLEDDFYNRNTRKPIEITCTFGITSSDTARILDDIVREFPQISNAVSHLQQSRFLRMTTKYFIRPDAFSLVSKIAMSESDEGNHEDNSTTLFEIADDVAPQVIELYRQAEQKRGEIEFYNTLTRIFDLDDFSRLRDETSRPRPDRPGIGRVPLRAYLERAMGVVAFRRQPLSAEQLSSLEAELARVIALRSSSRP